MEANIKDGFLIVKVPMNNPPTPPKNPTSKNLIVASSHGNQPTTAQVNGKPVIIGLNAYIKA